MINQPDGNPTHHAMAIRMKKKFDKYWGEAEKISGVLFMYAVLDPKFKLKLIKQFYSKCQKSLNYIEALCQKIEKMFKDLYNLYDKESSEPTHATHNTPTVLEAEYQQSSFFLRFTRIQMIFHLILVK